MRCMELKGHNKKVKGLKWAVRGQPTGDDQLTPAPSPWLGLIY